MFPENLVDSKQVKNASVYFVFQICLNQLEKLSSQIKDIDLFTNEELKTMSDFLFCSQKDIQEVMRIFNEKIPVVTSDFTDSVVKSVIF